MSVENISTPSTSNGHAIGNGTLSIRNEVDNTETSDITKNFKCRLKELLNLVSETKGCIIETRLTSIRNILDTIPGICAAHSGNLNIFHCLANNDEQNLKLLSLFGLCSETSDTEPNPLGPQPFTKYLNVEQLKELLEMPYSSLKQLTIHIAVEKGFTQFVKEVLKLFPALVSEIDGDGCTPLHYAAKSNLAESLECTNVLLEVMQNENLTSTVFCAKTTEKEETPLHTLCSYIPTNESFVAERMEAMLLSASSQEDNEPLIRQILKTYTKSGLTPLHLLCTRNKENVLTKNEDLSNRYELLKTIYKYLDSSEVKALTDDEFGYSILHLTVNSELPVLLQYLLQKVDKSMLGGAAKIGGKTVFHCADENSHWPEKYECLKHLVNWTKFKKTFTGTIDGLELHDFFCRSFLLTTTKENRNGNMVSYTALALACKSKSTKSVNLILRNMYYANPNIKEWFTVKSKRQQIYSLKDVYEHTPDALIFLFNKSIKIDMINSNENVVEFIVDLSVIEALHSPLRLVGIRYLELDESSPNNVHEKVLLHSLPYLALEKAWKTELRTFKILWTFFSVLWIALHMVLMPQICTKRQNESAGKNDANGNYTKVDCYPSHESSASATYKFEMHDYVAAWTLAVLTFFYFISEIYVTCKFGFDKHNKMGLVLDAIRIFLAFATALMPCFHSMKISISYSPNDFFANCSAYGIVLAGFRMFRNLAVIHLPIGKWIEYTIKGSLEILRLLVIVSPVIIGYIYAWQTLSPKVFKGRPADVGTFLAMIDGDTNIPEMFHQQSSWNFGEVCVTAFMIGFWVWFTSYMTISMAVVYEKISAMGRKLDMLGISSHIRLTNYIQRSVGCKCVLLFPWAFKRDENAQTVKWFIEWNKKHSRLSAFRCSIWRCCKKDSPSVGDSSKLYKFCGNGLPHFIKNVIHKLYKKELIEQRNLNSKISDRE